MISSSPPIFSIITSAGSCKSVRALDTIAEAFGPKTSERSLNRSSLLDQVIGLEIGLIFAIPFLTLPAVPLALTLRLTTGDLPLFLSRMGQKPSTTYGTGPLSGFCSLHCALSNRWLESTLPYCGNLGF